MAYGGLTGFIKASGINETPEQLAKRKTAEWRAMPEAEMEAVLVDLFTRVKGLLDERDKLRVAIEPFSRGGFEDDWDDRVAWSGNLTVGDFRRARAAYEGKDNA